MHSHDLEWGDCYREMTLEIQMSQSGRCSRFVNNGSSRRPDLPSRTCAYKNALTALPGKNFLNRAASAIAVIPYQK